MDNIFDLKNIDKNDLYVGDLYIVTNTSEDYTRSILAKKDAILIKLFDNHYIDLDSIKSKIDITIINEMLSCNYKDNNRILSDIVDKPYIGKLFIGSLEKTKEYGKLLELKNTL